MKLRAIPKVTFFHPARLPQAMSSLVVRPVRPEEWARLRDFRLRALATDPGAFGATHAEEAAMPEARWRERAEGAPGRATFVAERPDGGWAGIVTALEAGGGAAEVVGLWTAPEARGAGVGRALVEAAHAWARARGAARLVLWLDERNAPARRLYEACGYVPAGEPRQGRTDPSRRFQRMERDA